MVNYLIDIQKLDSALVWAHLRQHPLVTALVSLIVFATYRLFLKPILYPSPYRNLPGPKRLSWFLGNRIAEALGANHVDDQGNSVLVKGPGEVLRHYVQQANSLVILFPDAAGSESIHIADPHALSQIAGDINTFQSNELRTIMVDFIVGAGLPGRFGEAHRKQRKLMSPAFTPASLKSLTPVFCEFGDLLCAQMKTLIEQQQQGAANRDSQATTLNMSKLLDCTMLDIIGRAGFGYEFNALLQGQEANPLSVAFNESNQAAIELGIGRAIHLAMSAVLYPKAGSWPVSDANRKVQKVNKIMYQITMDIIQRKKAEIGKQADGSGGEISDMLNEKKDLISLLVRANSGVSVADQMTDKEMAGQIQAFLFAGYETSAGITAWTLYALATHPDIQRRLRETIAHAIKKRKGIQLQDLTADDLTYDDLWSEDLKYLDWVFNETLRMNPPVVASDRLVTKDVQVPLMKPIPSRDGKSFIKSLSLEKGTNVQIGIKTINFSKELYGPDAEEFNPDRWGQLPKAHSLARLPPYGMYTFIGGPKTCIGARFSLTEMKAILILLLRDFEFSQVEGVEIIPQLALLVRPRVVGDEGGGSAMPLCVKRIQW